MMCPSFLSLKTCFITVSLYVFGLCENNYEVEENYPRVTPQGYNKYETPLQTSGKPTPVYVILQIMAIDEIKEQSMEYSVQFFVHEIWDDPRLVLDEYKKKGVVLLPHVVKETLWVPDLTFVNSKGGWIYPLSLRNSIIKIHPDGSLVRYTRYYMRISCAMNLRNYPMDTQNCVLNMTPLANDETKMTLHWFHEKEKSPFTTHRGNIPSVFMAHVKLLKFTVSGCTDSKSVSTRFDGNYTTLSANFTFTRRVSSHIFNMYIPSALVVALSHLTFWLDVSSVPARVALGVTSLLTLSTQASQARQHLPPVDYLTALDVWLFVCILMVFASLVEFAAVYHLYNKKKCNLVSNATQQVVTKAWSDRACNKTSPFLRRTSDGVQLVARNINRPEPDEQSPSDWNKKEDYTPSGQLIDRISRIAFPTVFCLFAVMYWACYLNAS